MPLPLDNIYHGDCLTLMPQIPDASIDAVICDLPYGVLHRSNPHARWDQPIPFEPLWAEYERIIRPNGIIILFAQGMFTARLMLSNTRLWRYNLIWDKGRVTGFLNANRMPMRQHEDICIFYKKLPPYHPQYVAGQPNHPRGNGHHRTTNSCYGSYSADHHERTYDSVPRVAPTVPEGMKLPTSILSIQKEHETTVFHPTQKPVALIRYLIRTYTNPGVILDNCMGSGTTAIAAIREHRHFLGFELNEEYFNIAQQRIRLELRQPTLPLDV